MAISSNPVHPAYGWDLACPIKRHGHKLQVVSSINQDGTGTPGAVMGCPLGTYRWLIIDGRLNDYLRMVRPRWGWKRL